MKVEPRIDHPSLLACVNKLYGLPIASLTFVPIGECSAAYVAMCSDGARYFLKLWPDSRQARMLRAKLEITLPITRELYDRGIIANLSYPLRTSTGALKASFGEYVLALFPFFPGRPLTDSRLSAARLQLARTMAALHCSTHILSSPLPADSAFDVSFASDMRRGLAAVDNIGPDRRGGQVRLRDLLLPRREELLARLAETEQLAGPASRRAGQLVLCHTDMGGDNVLVDDAGTLFILDWDDLILAPAEHDLQEFRGPDFAHFLARYIEAGGISTLDPHQFAFYLQRRYLVDLTDWLIRILEENTDPAQDESDLAGLEAYCLARLDKFAAEMDEIAQALATVDAMM